MKIKVFIGIIILFCCQCRFPVDSEHEWYFDNQTNDTLYVYFALDFQTAYPDTSLPIDPNKANIMGAPPHKRQEIYNSRNIPYDKIIHDLPKDTLSVFLFYQDTLLKYNWEEIRQGYKILKRYDLSLDDIRFLYKNHTLVIPYPPDESMKSMKMYPPYGSNE